jgi:membrane-associated protein
MNILSFLLNFILHLDEHLIEFVAQYGLFTYGVLFFVIFIETGFVVTPFLPGDSLLFAAGTIAALDSLGIGLVITLLIIAAILGDTANYWIGHYFGKKIIGSSKNRLIKQEHIAKTEEFYEKYGGKTIILARFVPIVRTFAPFVAGIGTMEYKKFIFYNVIGGVLWVTLFTLGGYFFGNIPFIQENFHYAVFLIILLSLLPMVYEYVQHKKKSKRAIGDNIDYSKITNT